MTTEFKYLDYEGLKLFKEKLEHLRLADKTDIVEVLNEISNEINNGKLSIYINGTLLNEFTANQAGNTDVNIIVPTELGDLNNSVEFIKNVIKYGQPNVSDLTDDQKESLHNQTSEESGLVSEDALETTLTSYGTNINYDTEHQKIQLRHNNTVLSEIDAADFIKDSMIQDISVTDGTGDNAGLKVLLIDFNSESGVQDIEIPISEFFNPDNYYVKNDFADVALSGSYTDLSNTPSTLTLEEVNQGTNSDGKLVTAKIIRDSIDSAINGDNSKVITDDNLSEKVLTAGFAKSVLVGNNTPTIADVNGVLFVPEQKQADWNENNTSDKAYIQNKPIVYNLSEIQNIVKYGQPNVDDLTDEEKTEAEQENGFVKNSDLPEYEISGSNYTWNFKKNNTIVSTITIPEPQIPTNLSSFTNDVPFLVLSDIANLVDSDSVYTKNEIDLKIEYISNGSITLDNYYNKTQINNLLSELSYNNLQDLPTIPDALIQSDWNQTDTSAKDYIKNKPTLFSGSYDDLTDKPNIPTNLSDLYNDANYLVLGDVYSKNEIDLKISNSQTFDSTLYYTKAEIDNAGYLTLHLDISGKANIADLADVATSGNYNDLDNKPVIPTNISDLTNDIGYLTEHQSLENYASKDWVNDKIDDILGVNANGINTLILILSDDDKTTGILSVINNKQDIISDLLTIRNNALTGASKISNVKADWNETNENSEAYILNKPNLFSGSWNDLSNKPTLFTGSWNDLTDKPNLFSGSWNDLTDKPSSSGAGNYSNLIYTYNNINPEGGQIILDCSYNILKITTSSSISEVTLNNVPENYHSCHVIIKGTGDIFISDKTTVTINGVTYTLICPDGDLILSISSEGYVEFDILRIDNELFVRGV